MNTAFPGEGRLEVSCYSERLVVRVLRKHLDGVRNERLVPAVDQAEHVQDAGNNSRGIGAAAEPEQKHSIAGLVILHQEHICIPDIVLKPAPYRLTQKSTNGLRHPRPRTGR